eukprot:636850-Rhodomonas_salina.3
MALRACYEMRGTDAACGGTAARGGAGSAAPEAGVARGGGCGHQRLPGPHSEIKDEQTQSPYDLC